MCPGIAVLGGGGGGGGKGGKGAGAGGGGVGAGGNGGAGSTGPDGREAGSPDPASFPHCGTRSCPVDVITGRAFTLETVDFELPGPLPLRFFRVHSSFALDDDKGLGPGWTHSLAWEIRQTRRHTRVLPAHGTLVVFDAIEAGDQKQARWGWRLRRHANGYVLDANDGVIRHFEEVSDDGQRHRLTRVVDTNGNAISLHYDQGLLIEVVDSAGRTLRVRNNGDGHIVSIDTRNAVSRGQWVKLVEYSYRDEYLEQAIDPDGHANQYRYNDAGQLSENGYKCGIVFHFRYDELGRCTESWGAYPNGEDPSLADNLPTTLADGRTPIKGVHHCRYDYLADGMTQVHDSTRTTSYQGGAAGLLEKSVIGGGVLTAEYSDDGFLMAETDEVGATTRYERDDRGRILETTDPLNHVHRCERNGDGYIVRVINPDATETHITRDERGNILTMKDAEGGVTSFKYDSRGLPVSLTTPGGGVTRWSYDGQGNRIQSTSPTGGSWNYTYDALGRLLVVTDPTGATRSHGYSARGDLIAVRDPVGGTSRYAYDGDGFMIQAVNPQGAITRLRWGGLHKLVARTNAGGEQVLLRYNHEGEMLEVHNEAGEVHRLERDLVGLLVGETTFDGRQFRYRNDDLGRVTRMVDGADRTTEFSYDAAGRLIGQTFDDDSVRSFEYDWRGNLTHAQNDHVAVRFERDGLGRIIRESQRATGTEHWIEAGFSADGFRNRRLSSLGHQEQIERNAYGGRVKTIADGQLIEHQRDLLGRETERRLPGGGKIRNSYDAMSRLSRRTATGPSQPHPPVNGQPDWLGDRPSNATHDLAFGYAWDGELTQRRDSLRGTVTYQYDPVGQLLACVPEEAKQQLFSYDSRGNHTETQAGSQRRTYGAGNRLLSQGGVVYSYDRAGHLIEKRATIAGVEHITRYQWNGEGHLSLVELPDGTRLSYLYDALSRRIAKRTTGSDGVGLPTTKTWRFIWDGNHIAHDIRTHADKNGDPVVDERTFGFTDNQFEPLYQTYGGGTSARKTTLHCLNDQVGTVDCLLDRQGVPSWASHRSVWGAPAHSDSSDDDRSDGNSASPFAFQGQYIDEETGLHYNRHRYYDPEAGRFISPDPLGLDAGHHDYRYAPNPLQWIDPLGLVTAALMAAMKADGRPVPDGSTAHHIVQRNGGGDGGDRARACLARSGIGIDHAANGARLRGTARSQRSRAGHDKGCVGYHGGNDIHGDAAMTRVADRLEAAEARGGAAEVESELRTMGTTMETTSPGNRNL